MIRSVLGVVCLLAFGAPISAQTSTYEVGLSGAVAFLESVVKSAKQHNDKATADFGSRAVDLAKEGLKKGKYGKGRPNLIVNKRAHGNQDGKTTRVPKKKMSGWKEQIEIASVNQKKFQKRYDKFIADGCTHEEAKCIIDMLVALTVAHEMQHVNQDCKVDEKPGKNPAEKDAYEKEKLLAKHIRNHIIKTLKKTKALDAWIEDICAWIVKFS